MYSVPAYVRALLPLCGAVEQELSRGPPITGPQGYDGPGKSRLCKKYKHRKREKSKRNGTLVKHFEFAQLRIDFFCFDARLIYYRCIFVYFTSLLGNSSKRIRCKPTRTSLHLLIPTSILQWTLPEWTSAMAFQSYRYNRLEHWTNNFRSSRKSHFRISLSYFCATIFFLYHATEYLLHAGRLFRGR